MGSTTASASLPDPRGPTLRARLLGGFELRLGDAPLPPLDSARAEGLLAYLLLHRDVPQQRQHLAFLLWPDSTEGQARTNLRHVLHNVRRALPEVDRFVDVRPRTLQWRPDVPLWLDVAAFEQAVADGRLEAAVETYTGELLAGRYDEWMLAERGRLARLHVGVLDRLAVRLAEEGRLQAAVAYAERLVAAEPLREDAYRLLIRLRDTSGDRAGAVRAYHLCAATLQRELGVAPSAATRAVYEDLLPGRTGPADLMQPGRAPLVGRGAEQSRLAGLWRAAARGRPHFVLVTGEAGIGKSRLVEELSSWCAQTGADTADARAYPAEGTIAYGIVAAWLRSEAFARRLRGMAPAPLTDLARLAPEVLSGRGIAAPEPLPEAEQRRRVFAAVAQAVVATGTPLLLVADDAQWCDVESLRFLHYLLRARPEARVLVAATARREEVDLHHPLHRFVAALQALGRFSEVDLGRLTRQETGVLAERFTGAPLGAGDLDRLYADSEGNPLFIVEALRAARETAQPAGGTAGTARGQAVIASRLAQLTPPAAELVGVAATVGREFTTEVLADAARVDEETLVRGLDELWRRGIVRAQGPTAYDFSHGKIREAAYAALGPARRRHHHLHVAEALQRLGGGDPGAVSGQVAAHYDRAGATGEAVAWYGRAAEAAALHASADAVRFLERAVVLAGRIPADAGRDAIELRLLTALPAALVAVEGYLSERVAAVHARAADLAAHLGVEPEPPLLRSMALAMLSRGDFASARPFGEQLRTRADRDADDVLWVESAYILGVAAFWQGRLGTAREHFRAAVARYRPEHRSTHVLRYGQDPQVFCLLRLGYTLWLLGEEAEADSASVAALTLAERSEQPYTRAAADAWAGLLAVDRHDEERLRRHVRALQPTDAPERPAQISLAAQALAGLVDVLDGRARAGVDRVRNALEDARRVGPAAPGLNGFLMRILLEACAAAADPHTGLAATDEALVMGGGAELWEAETRRLRGEFLGRLGAGPDAVEDEFRRALDIAERQGARPFERRVRDALAALGASRDRGTPVERPAGTIIS